MGFFDFFTKKKKLSKLIALGPQTAKGIDRFYQEMAEAKKYLGDCFPDDAAIQATIADMPTPAEVPNNVFTAKYLPYHLKDIRWMIQYVTNYFESRDLHFDPYTIQTIVAGFRPFIIAREAYKQRLIKAQIEYMLHAEKPNGLIEVSLPILRSRPDYDRLFRMEISNSMDKLGIEKDFIEIGLETNADLWRTPTMVKSFVNRYYPQGTQDPMGIMNSHCNFWLKKREYEYYQEHKESVDKWGLETRNMDLNEVQLRNLNKQIEYHTQMYSQFVRRPRFGRMRMPFANRHMHNANVRRSRMQPASNRVVNSGREM